MDIVPNNPGAGNLARNDEFDLYEERSSTNPDVAHSSPTSTESELSEDPFSNADAARSGSSDSDRSPVTSRGGSFGYGSDGMGGFGPGSDQRARRQRPTLSLGLPPTKSGGVIAGAGRSVAMSPDQLSPYVHAPHSQEIASGQNQYGSLQSTGGNPTRSLYSQSDAQSQNQSLSSSASVTSGGTVGTTASQRVDHDPRRGSLPMNFFTPGQPPGQATHSTPSPFSTTSPGSTGTGTLLSSPAYNTPSSTTTSAPSSGYPVTPRHGSHAGLFVGSPRVSGQHGQHGAEKSGTFSGRNVGEIQTLPPVPETSSGKQQATATEYPTSDQARQSEEVAPAASKRRRGKHPKQTTDFLKDWLNQHKDHPYPSEEEKRHMCEVTGLDMNQVSNWMINARRRILVPAHKTAVGAPMTTAAYPNTVGNVMMGRGLGAEQNMGMGMGGGIGGGGMAGYGGGGMNMGVENVVAGQYPSHLLHPLSLPSIGYSQAPPLLSSASSSSSSPSPMSIPSGGGLPLSYSQSQHSMQMQQQQQRYQPYPAMQSGQGYGVGSEPMYMQRRASMPVFSHALHPSYSAYAQGGAATLANASNNGASGANASMGGPQLYQPPIHSSSSASAYAMSRQDSLTYSSASGSARGGPSQSSLPSSHPLAGTVDMSPGAANDVGGSASMFQSPSRLSNITGSTSGRAFTFPDVSGNAGQRHVRD